MSRVLIREITTPETISIRWPVLRPGFPRETAVFEGDNAPDTLHFGGFVDNRLVGVASLYVISCPDRPGIDRAWQLRGMATLPQVRGLGVGKALVAACEGAAYRAGDSLLWCNARTGAVDFYARLGWIVSSEEFDIPTVGPHRRMVRELTT